MIAIVACVEHKNFMRIVMELNTKREVSVFGEKIKVNELYIFTIHMN